MTDETTKVVDLSDFLVDRDPGDETDEPEMLEFPADDEGGVIEVSLEEVLAGFAQGLEILRLGLIEAYGKIAALEEKVFPEDANLDEPTEG